MRKSRLLFGPPDANNVVAMTDELLFVRRHRYVLEQLFKYDYGVSYPVDPQALPALKDIDIASVSTSQLKANNRFAFESECTRYETDEFAHALINDDYVNYLAAIRHLYADGNPYGHVDDWVVFLQAGSTRLRLHARGRISALHQNYMDEVTRTIARDAGVELPTAKVMFIVRAVHYEELRNVLQEE